MESRILSLILMVPAFELTIPTAISFFRYYLHCQNINTSTRGLAEVIVLIETEITKFIIYENYIIQICTFVISTCSSYRSLARLVSNSSHRFLPPARFVWQIFTKNITQLPLQTQVTQDFSAYGQVN